MEQDQLFTEFNVGAARQISLSAEVRMRVEYNIKEKRKLRSVVDEQTELLKVKDEEIENLKAQLSLKEEEAAKAICLRAEASKFEAIEKSLEQEVADLDAQVTAVKSQSDNLTGRVHELKTSSAGLQEKVTAYEDCMGKLEELQDERMRVVDDKFDKLYAEFLAIVKCLHSPEYLSALRAAISKANEKGMQDGLAAGITHGQEELQDINFYLLAELKSNKDASVETLTNILRLEETLAERLGLNESQPHVDQLMVSIHHSSDQTVVGATSLSALRDVFVLLAEPLSSVALEGTEGTFGTAPGTTTALSVTFASVSSIPPISTDDYEVVHADGQEGVGADANPFPNVDGAELNIQ
ncbi:hypothetical protein Tco_1039061 [Tanacetum coccineum]